MGKDEMNKTPMSGYLGSRKMDGNQGVVYPFLFGIFKIFQIKKKFKKIKRKRKFKKRCFHFLEKWETALEEIIVNPRLMAERME